MSATLLDDLKPELGLEDRVGRAWRKPHFIENRWLRWGLLAATIVYLYLAVNSIEVNWSRVAEGLTRGWDFVVAFANPDFTLALGRHSRRNDRVRDHHHCFHRRGYRDFHSHRPGRRA